MTCALPFRTSTEDRRPSFFSFGPIVSWTPASTRRRHLLLGREQEASRATTLPRSPSCSDGEGARRSRSDAVFSIEGKSGPRFCVGDRAGPLRHAGRLRGSVSIVVSPRWSDEVCRRQLPPFRAWLPGSSGRRSGSTALSHDRLRLGRELRLERDSGQRQRRVGGRDRLVEEAGDTISLGAVVGRHWRRPCRRRGGRRDRARVLPAASSMEGRKGPSGRVGSRTSAKRSCRTRHLQ